MKRYGLLTLLLSTSALGAPLDAADRATVQVSVSALKSDPFAIEPLRALETIYKRGPGMGSLVGEYQTRSAGKTPAVADLIVLGRLQLELGKRSEGLKPLKQAAKLSKDPRTLLSLARILDDNADRQAAILAYQAGMPGASESERRGISLRLGALYLAAGKTKEARQEWDAAKRAAPDDQMLRRQIAEALASRGAFHEAIIELKEIEALLEKKRDPLALSTVIRREADLARRVGDTRLVYDSLLRAYLLATHARQHALRAELTVDLFRAYKADKGAAPATRAHGLEELAKVAKKAEVKDPMAATLLGDVEAARGEQNAAIDAFRRALKYAPGDPYILRRLCSLETGDARIRDLSSLFEVELNDATMGFDLVTALFELKRNTDAVQKAQVLQKRFPDNVLVLTEIAHLLSKNGAHAEALAALERVLQLDPHQPDHLIGYGDELRALGRAPEATKAYFRLVEKDRSLSSYRQLIDVLSQRRLTADLQRAYKEATAQAPDNQSLRRDYARWLGGSGMLDEALVEWKKISSASNDPFLKDFATREIKRIESQKMFAPR